MFKIIRLISKIVLNQNFYGNLIKKFLKNEFDMPLQAIKAKFANIKFNPDWTKNEDNKIRVTNYLLNKVMNKPLIATIGRNILDLFSFFLLCIFILKIIIFLVVILSNKCSGYSPAKYYSNKSILLSCKIHFVAS